MTHAEKVAQVSRALEAVGLTVDKSGPPEADLFLPQVNALVRVCRGYPTTPRSSSVVLTIDDVNVMSVVYLRQKIYQLLMGYALPREGGGQFKTLSEAETEAVRRNVLYAYGELSELLSEFPWKWHREADPVDRLKVAEEFGDLLVFLLNVLAQVGITDDEREAGLERIQRKNFTRYFSGVNKEFKRQYECEPREVRGA
ncbi:hypothetical protein LCGC14_1698950 [marine sediment metagenome]|uniref:Uncharacterized protein n=1 Tax=marine sediment metagenome TaxID=412755 RepID=A0A0F9HJ51_9ZZZZ